MTNNNKPVIGPLGLPLTRENLPPPHTKRWVRRRKAEVVVAVKFGLLTMQEATARYNLSDEEFFSWYEAYHAFGITGLQIGNVSGRTAKARL
jgi:hypothetical protein